jgi:magnesium chelatase subunit D
MPGRAFNGRWTRSRMGARTHSAFPFAAVVGMDAAREALMLLAIDPGLKGALIASGAGAAKTLLARSFRSLVPDTAFLELPLGITDDRLLGGVDFGRTILTGRRRILPGLLARVRGGFLHADEVNLLDRTQARHVASELTAGEDFSVIGTYDPVEGGVDDALADAVALHVTEAGCPGADDRFEILRRVAAFDRDPVAFAQRFAVETGLYRKLVCAARGRLAGVNATLEDRQRLSAAAVRLGVEGNRADIFALRAARAHAALEGRTFLEEEDLKAAVRLVLSPRARSQSEEAESAAARAPARNQRETFDAPAEDLVIEPIDCDVPEQLLNIAASDETRSRSTRRGRSHQPHWNRGRCIRTVTKRPQANRIALMATLVAAAGTRITPRDLRYKQFRQNSGILIVFAVDASGSMAVNRIHQAKGALIRLLGKAYLNRDQVALVGFRGDRAEVLLAPTRGVELAKRALDSMPVGGGTPLAAGLEAALELVRRARLVARETLLVLLTDGKANVARNKEADPEVVRCEVEQVCAELRAERVSSVVIDTTHRAVSSGAAGGLAELLDGRLVYLPHPHPNAICDAVSAAAEIIRS